MDTDSDDDGSIIGNEDGGSQSSQQGGEGGFGMDLTGILFGNIDSEGKLMDDDGGGAFDSEFREHLGSLAKMGLHSMLNEVIEREDVDDEEVEETEEKYKEVEETKKPLSDFDALKSGLLDPKSEQEDENGEIIKDADAVDYSDITELSEDCPKTPPTQKSEDKEGSSNGMQDLEEAIPASTVQAINKDDKELMPPPSIPLRNNIQDLPGKSGSDSGMDSDTKHEKAAERKLDTPLADMLPSKYANVDVRELFPDFRPDKVLRFSRLFGPGKPSSLPQIWRHVKKRRRKRKQSRDHKLHNPGSDSTSDSEEPRKKGFGLHYGPEPKPSHCQSDDEDKLLSIFNDEDIKQEPESGDNNENKPKIADWRYGPAQIWYDMLEVPDSGDGFNYGFKVRHEHKNAKSMQHIKKEEPKEEIKEEHLADDAFLMVSQLHWEDEVVWDGNEIKAKVLQKLNSKTNAAGWLPSSGSRAFTPAGKTLPVTGSTSGKITGSSSSSSNKQKSNQNLPTKPPEAVDDTWYSIFPVENEELIYSKWEDEIIWDAEEMTKIPKPKVLTLDPNDENIILGIPDDIDPSKINKNTGPPPKIKIPHPHVKKSKILLGKAGVINVLAEDTPPPPPKSPDRDPFNISNDSYYMPKAEPTLRLKVGGGSLIQHSTPVVELRSPFIPTHMGPIKLRAFHRPPLKKYSYGPISQSVSHSVLPLLKHIFKKAKQRDAERIASGGGDVFFMRNPEDLSGKDGDIILAEFCEEHPPLMNQVGMCSKIKNYYKRKATKDNAPQDFKYGETAIAHTSPFLGILHPGQCIQALENNMYRAPIYPHSVSNTDFLVIRTRNNYWIREYNAIFTVGQECPLYEVPGPNSKRANNFTRDFLQVFIYRLFWKSADNPRRIRMDDIKRAFPAHSESSIRKRLKQCADFKRTGMDSNWWVIKPEFRLPSEEEIRAMVSPEQCCAYFSMIAAEQRLKDAGYGEKFLFAPQEDDDEEAQLKLDDEVKVAPWNTTRAYIQAMRGKCLLQLTGPADPTGCGEGFSYVRVPNKPTQTKEEQESQPKRTVTGTDADLRRLPLQRAKELLRKFKVPEEEIKKLSRWEVIDVVRTLSTEKAKAGEQGMDKFSRGNRFSIAEHQERYKEECQRIFDLQNRVLASSEVLSTDEDESSASEESDLEELGKNLENMLSNKKTSTQLTMEREEQERQELLKKIMEDEEGNKNKGDKNKDGNMDSQQQSLQNSNQGRILKITRTFKDSEGKEYTRVETVRRQPIIDAYVKIRTTKDEQFIKQFATLDEQQKEEMKREKRRIQEQLRRIKRNQERERLAQLAQNQKLQPGGMPTSLGDPKTSQSSSHKERDNSHKEVSPSRKKFKLKPDLKLKCGACGQVGHMRTNKACPLYTGTQGPPTSSLNMSMNEEPDEEPEREERDREREREKNIEEDDLVNVDGTKVTLSSKLLKRHDEGGRKKALLLKVPKDVMGKKKRRMASDIHCDYLQRHNKTANRRRTDPVVVLSSILEEILNDLRAMPDVTPFMFPVNAKLVPDYYRIVIKPMDLQTMRDNIRQKRYHSREEFLADLNQIVENSTLYNGPNSSFTNAAQRMLKSCFDLLAEKEDKLMRLEKAINPLLDDDDQVALSFIFEKLHGKIKLMQESWPFLKPVNKKQVKDYYTIIKRPMDLESIGKNVEAHRYHSRGEFLGDIELIATNCEQYNGSESRFTKNAKHILEYARSQLDEFAEHCTQLEQNIAKVQERARADAELDDTWGGDDQEYDYMRTSRSSTPENDFIDVEGNERASTSSAASFQRGIGGHISLTTGQTATAQTPDMAPPVDIKRGRGRPRKQRDTVEEVIKNCEKKTQAIESYLIPKIIRPYSRRYSVISANGRRNTSRVFAIIRCRKSSLEKRRRDQRNAQIKYREKHGDFQRERNRQLTALRRTNEDYRIEERSKCRKAMRKKRFCEQMKKKVELKAQEYLVKNEFDNNIPVNCITDREREHELSYSIINGYGYNERNSFPKLENYYLQEGLQRETSGLIEQSNPNKPHPTGICASNAEFCMPIPVKKFIKFNPNAVKRGRGRPRKDSLASNISNPHNSSFLEEDLQCSTDDDEDGFQEVSEDENNPASFLEGERVHSMSTAGGSEGGSDLIDAAHIKTEMKIEPTHLGGDDSMDLDPNYDPSDFLTMHSRMGNNETNQQQQDNKMSQFLQHEEGQNENIQTTHDNKANMHQMPLMMGSNDNMGIDDDLAISESDEEDDGNVRVKRELFTDQLEDDQEQQQMLQQQSIIDMQMQQQQQQQEQLPIQSYVDIDASKEDYQQQQEQHHQPQTQPSHHDDNNDDDWLRF